MAKYSKKEKEEAIETLRKFLPPGSRVYCSIGHVSRSGMYRTIKLYTIVEDKENGCYLQWLSHLVAIALGERFDHKEGSVGVSGCGMDMGFHLVHNLSYVLHGMQSVGKDAIATAGRPFQPTREQYHAGYSLTHEWI